MNEKSRETRGGKAARQSGSGGTLHALYSAVGGVGQRLRDEKEGGGRLFRVRRNETKKER